MGNLIILLISAGFLFATSVEDMKKVRRNSNRHPKLIMVHKNKINAFVFKEQLDIASINIDSLMQIKKSKTRSIYIFQDSVSNFSYIDIDTEKKWVEKMFLTKMTDNVYIDEIWSEKCVAFIIQKRNTAFDQTLVIVGLRENSEKTREVFKEILKKTKLGAYTAPFFLFTNIKKEKPLY